MNFEIQSKLLTNLSNTKLEKVEGIVIHLLPQYFGEYTAKWNGYTEISKSNKDNIDYGFHYGMDQYDIINYIPVEYQAISIKSNPTYISSALFGQKPETRCISLCLFINKEHDYSYTEEKFIRFIVKLLRDNKLTSTYLWRGFDLSKDDNGPLHILDLDIFKKYISLIDKYLEVTDENLSEEEQQKIDDKIEFISPFKVLAESSEPKLTINEYIIKFYEDHKSNIDSYASKFNPYDKELKEVIEYKEKPSEGKLTLSEYPSGNKLQYKITQNPPLSGCNCSKATDKLDGVNTTKETMVEPIYPDLITPPGGDIHIANGNSSSVTQNQSNTPLTVEEFEKRQKTFSIDNFKDIKKSTIGRPINCDDEFPVDAQIKKLEEHFPKVKIDKIKFDYEEDNHLGSVLGNALAKNYNMTYDMVAEISKRTEQRLVKIENNLSTVMRNLFRISSRVNINCVYYGGQSVYGKYKCIRCLQDDRINDGAIVTLDQCLSCTRYEPIVGQVYAILDEAGSNVTQVIDDMQMSYMSLEEYKTLNKIEEMHSELSFANLKEDSSETPIPFSKDKWRDTEEEMKAKNYDPKEMTEETLSTYKNGFIMDWNPSLLETQASAINKYNIEFKELNKVENTEGAQKLDRDLFIDSRKKAVEYEKLEFDVNNYTVKDFSKGKPGSKPGGSFGMGSAEARKKIVDYALEAVKLSTEGKAKYSQNLRYSHGDKSIDGIHYWDCSSLVQRAYEAAGISGIGTTTHSQYPFCLNSAGGVLFPITDVKDALPGDMVWFMEPPLPTDNAGFQTVPYTDGMIVHHIAIYIGDNKYAHAAFEGANPDIKISTLGYYNHEMCFGRIKPLIELDKQASVGGAGEGYWSRDLHDIPDYIWNLANSAEGNAEKAINNMNKYGYKDVLIEVAKAKGYDPYLVLSIAATESGGDPTTGGYGGQEGLMQTDNGRPASSVDGIKAHIDLALSNLNRKKVMLTQYGWTEDNLAVLMHAYNCGEGSTTTASGHFQQESFPMPEINLSTCKIPEIGEALGSYAEKYGNLSMPDARRAYPTKVLRAYNYLFTNKALE